MSVCAAVLFSAAFISCGRSPGEPKPGTVRDEAQRAGVAPEQLVHDTDDYFHDMDFNLVDGRPHRPFTKEEIQGRNMWIVWTGGNDTLWDRLTIDSLGTFDLLKIISSHPYAGDKAYADNYGRHNRWSYLGVVDEPCFEEAKGPDPNRFGLWLDVRRTGPDCPPDPFADATRYPGVKIGARGTTVPVSSYYGEPTGVVGLRLLPNPAFDENARKRWTPSATTTIRTTTSTATWCARIGSACRAVSATSVRIRSSRRPMPRTRSGRT